MDLRFADGSSAGRAQFEPRTGPDAMAELATAAGEDGWLIEHALPLLLATFGGESSDRVAFRKHHE
jgi:hypothetical protein